jgi:hypothetical protein
MLARSIQGTRSRLETVFANANGLRVVLESSNGLRVPPEINESSKGATLALLESKRTRAMRIESGVMSSIRSVARCTCSIQGVVVVVIVVGITGGIRRNTSLRRALVVLEAVLRSMLRARGVMMVTHHVSSRTTSSCKADTFAEAV